MSKREKMLEAELAAYKASAKTLEAVNHNLEKEIRRLRENVVERYIFDREHERAEQLLHAYNGTMEQLSETLKSLDECEKAHQEALAKISRLIEANIEADREIEILRDALKDEG